VKFAIFLRNRRHFLPPWSYGGDKTQCNHIDNRSETKRLSQKDMHFSGLITERMERAKRFELSTSTLARLRSTPELRPRPSDFQQTLEGRDNTHHLALFKREFRFIF
jgi:hypothetical protein